MMIKSHGHTLDDLARLSGVPAATTSRFLSGVHGEPRPKTLQCWARAYNLTEAQLRGFDPIEGCTIENPREPTTLESVLSKEEVSAIEGMRSLDKETRRAWLKIGKELCRNDSVPEKKPVSRNRMLTGVSYKKVQSGGFLAGKQKA